MKMNISILCLAVIALSGCTVKATPITSPDGHRGFYMDCNSGIDACYQESAKLCPEGYDIIDHSTKTSTLLPHYGEYTLTIIKESLTIQCQ